MIEDDIYTRLTTFAGLSALTGTRVYPSLMPQQSTLPVIVYQQISGAPLYSQSGDAGVATSRFQFSVYDDTYDGCSAVAEQLRLALSGYKGGGIMGAFLQLKMDMYDPELQCHRVLEDYRIWYGE